MAFSVAQRNTRSPCSPLSCNFPCTVCGHLLYCDPRRTFANSITVNGDTVMCTGTFFLQACPTCGRQLQVHVQHLGKMVSCQHCHGRFTATDPSAVNVVEPSASDSLIARADELIASTSSRKAV